MVEYAVHGDTREITEQTVCYVPGLMGCRAPKGGMKMRKKSFYLLLSFAVILLLAACGIKLPNPDEIPNSVNIVYKNQVQLPLSATSITVKDYVLDTFDAVTEDLPMDATVSGWNPMTLEVATSIEYNVGNYLESITLDLSEAEQSFDVQVTGIELEGPTVSFNVPSVSDPDPVVLDVATGKIEKTVEFSGFSEVSFSSGNLVVEIEYVGDTVTTMGIDVEGLGSVSFNNVTNGETASDTIALSGKSLGSSVNVTLTATMADLLGTGNATVTLKFEGEEISSISGISLSISQTVPLPASVKDVEIGSGVAKLVAAGLSFQSVSGTLQYAGGSKSLYVDGGALLVDLSGVTLPATLILNGVDVVVTDQSVIGGSVNSALGFEGVVLSRVKIETSDLAIATSVRADLSGIEGVRRVSFSDGWLQLQYNNTLPATIDVKIESPELGVDELVKLPPKTEDVAGIDLSGLTLDLETNDSITISIDASPEGYDGMYLELSNVELGNNFELTATSSVRDLKLGSVVIAAQNIEMPLAEGMDLSDLLADATRIIDAVDLDSVPLEAKLWMEQLGLDMDATFTLHASWTGYSTEITISPDATFADVSGLLRKLFEDLPSDLFLSVDGEIGEATITVDSAMRFSMDLKIPLEFDLISDIEVFSTDVSIPVEVSDVATMLETLDAATLVAQVKNNTGVNVSATLVSAGITIFSGTLGEEETIVIPVTSETIREIIESGSLHLELALPSGHYAVNGEGSVLLTAWVDMLLSLETTVDLKGGGE